MTGTERQLADAILALLDARADGATICPSEAARRVAGDADDAWRELMPAARAVASQLVADGRIEVTQGGEVTDPATARGPIRLRRLDPER